MLKKIFNLFGYTFSKYKKSDDINEIIKFRIKNIKPDLYIDCGANYGQFTDAFLNNNDQFILFEPNPYLFDKLKVKYKKYKNIKIFPYGVGNKEESKKLYITNDTGKTLSSIKEQHPNLKKNFRNTQIVKTTIVEIKNIKKIILENKLINKNKIFLKLDTQGNDYEALMGIKNIINRVKLLKIELSVLPIYKKIYNHWSILEYLKKKKFSPIFFVNGEKNNDGKIIEYDCLFEKN